MHFFLAFSGCCAAYLLRTFELVAAMAPRGQRRQPAKTTVSPCDRGRVWAKHQTITDPGHRQAADQLRRDRLTVVPAPAEQPVELRRLDDYDLAFGLVDDQPAQVGVS